MSQFNFDYKFVTHTKITPTYGARVDVDSCSDGSIWLRMDGGGIRGSSMLTVAQASELAIALRDALFAVGKPPAAVMDAAPPAATVIDKSNAILDASITRAAGAML